MRRWYIVSVMLLGIATTPALAQTSFPIQFLQDPARSTQVSSINRGGVVYGSLSDLARTFNIRTTSIPGAQKIELRADAFTIKLTANNSFIVIVDRNSNANLVQLPMVVALVGGAFYVPVEAFLPTLKNIVSEELTFDRGRIIVGKSRPKSAYDIAGLTFDEKSNGFLVRILCTKKLSDYESWMKLIGTDTWLYITLANARADVPAIRNVKPSGLVKQILVFQSPTSVQLTLRLKGQVNSTELIPAEGSDDILVAIHLPTETQLASRKAREYERSLQRERDRWKLDVVVIDAGHGGEDPGTIGVTHVKEKDVTLGIALKLGKLIEKQLPKVKVVYTRKTDTFVELYRRGQIANEHKGKLFISVHCNAMPRKPHPMNGFEIYLLRPGKTENAVRIAERENSAVRFEQGYEKHYQQLTDENFILVAMAQSAFVKYSEHFADIMQQEMGRHLDISNNGIKQAGFYVLVGASMPNVLVETAYLSNAHDEKILRSAKGQQRIAEAIFGGVKRYKQEYEKSLEEGKEMGAGTR